MAKQYYYFIAGLPSVSIDDSKLIYSPEQFRLDASGQLSSDDMELLNLLHLPDDLANLIIVLYKTGKDLSAEGLYSESYWQGFLEYLKAKAENNSLSVPDAYRNLPVFIGEIILTCLGEEELPAIQSTEHNLLSGFFAYCANHANSFIQAWFDHERCIRNILLAINARHHDLPFTDYLIGDDETANNLRKSHAQDFNLGKDHPLFDPLLRIWEQNNILFRERGYDILRIKWIDNQNFFEYFNIDRILGYYTKLRLISRWINADPDHGKEVFQDTLDKLENSFSFPDEFNIRITRK
jgi:hypothetical protein